VTLSALSANDAVRVFLICFFAIVTTEASTAGELVRIEGIPVPQSQLAINQGAQPVQHHYFGHHFLPEAQTPSPYIVLLPGCGGLDPLVENTLFSYAEEFVSRGYGAIVIDTLRGTGIDHTCIDQTGPSYVMAALSAAQFAKDTPFSNGKIGIAGQSKGGTAALRMSSNETRSTFIYGNVDTWFDAAVAFYPQCSSSNLVVPVLILIGENDDWTPSTHCKRWIEQGSAENLEVRFYPNAHHGFDITDLTLWRPFGFHVGYHQKAAEDARERMFEFFDDNLK
jgi:dienelactone hydrolase